MKSTHDAFGYTEMIHEALRGVVRKTLQRAQEFGMPLDHHFYITFKTMAQRVVLPLYLRQKYPESMTIVLQYQFHNLRVGDKGFSVSLSFGGKFENLYIPFSAVEMFSDPEAELVLNFEGNRSEHEQEIGLNHKPGRIYPRATNKTDEINEPTQLLKPTPSNATRREEPQGNATKGGSTSNSEWLKTDDKDGYKESNKGDSKSSDSTSPFIKGISYSMVSHKPKRTNKLKSVESSKKPNDKITRETFANARIETVINTGVNERIGAEEGARVLTFKAKNHDADKRKQDDNSPEPETR